MSVSINLSEGNQVTIQRVDPTAVTLLNLIPNEVTIQQQSPIAVSLANAVANQVNVQQQDNIAVSLTNHTPIAVTVNSQVSSGGGAWGEITGTVTDQTDLTTYVANNALQDGQEVLDALNEGGLEAITLGKTETPVKVFNISVTDADGLRGYSLPLPLDISDKYGYFLFTDSDGSLGWKPFPLEFLTGQAEEAKVDGGDF